MTDHVHLLPTPSETGQVGAVMQALGRRHVRYVNDRDNRTGTLWEGRYNACPVDSNSYLPHRYRYIELNPVRAAMAAAPEEYRRSSHAANALGAHDPLLEPRPAHLALGEESHPRKVHTDPAFGCSQPLPRTHSE